MCLKTSHSLFVPMAALLVGLASTASGDLAGHWRLDEVRGAIAHDSSGNGNDGILVGDPEWVPGYDGGGLGFDGSGDYVDCGAGESLNITGSVTVAAWIRLDGPAEDLKIAGNQDGKTGGYKLGIYNNRAEFEIRTANNEAVLNRNSAGGTVLEAGLWYHVAGVYSQGEYIRTYVNGELDRELMTSAPIGGSTGTFKLGREPFSDSYFWLGVMDDVRVYSRALTSGEIIEFTWRRAARQPNPANGAAGVVTPLLTWTPGDGAVFHDVYFGTTPDLSEGNLVAARASFAMYYHTPGFQPGVTYYWRVDEIDTGGTIHVGDVWSFDSVPVNSASRPDPAGGIVNLDTGATVTLSWTPGLNAITHHVYFGVDVNEVVAADTSSPVFLGSQDETTRVVGSLGLATTYYWRVDEIDVAGTVQAGEVWSFTTSGFILIDDFETYDDDLNAGTAIFQTWIDGFGYGPIPGNGSGMRVGHPAPPFAEQTIVYSGRQSMPLEYNNANPPFYSEAERTLDVPQSPTVEGAEALSLFVHGRADNAPEPLYIGLEDNAGGRTVVIHPDPEIVLTEEWSEWQISLEAFADINIRAIRKIFIGVDGREGLLKSAELSVSAAAGGGTIYVDCISLVSVRWCTRVHGYVRDASTAADCHQAKAISNAKKPRVEFKPVGGTGSYTNSKPNPADGEYYVCVRPDVTYDITVTANGYKTYQHSGWRPSSQGGCKYFDMDFCLWPE